MITTTIGITITTADILATTATVTQAAIVITADRDG